MSDLDFIPEDYDVEEAAEEAGGYFKPIPNGWYQAVIKKPEVVDCTGGVMLKAGFQITGPSHEGRWVFDQMLLRHTTPLAQKIGMEKFSSLCVAAGFRRRPKQSALLADRKVMVKLGREKYEGEERNKVKAYKAIPGANPPSGGAGQTATPPPPQSAPAGGAPASTPWSR